MTLTSEEHDALLRAVEGGYFDNAIRSAYSVAALRWTSRGSDMPFHSRAAAPRVSEFLGREFQLDADGAYLGPATGPFWTAWAARHMRLLFPH